MTPKIATTALRCMQMQAKAQRKHCESTATTFLQWLLLNIPKQFDLLRPRCMGLLLDTRNCGTHMFRECRKRFPRHRGLAIPACITTRASRTRRDACRDRWQAVSFEVGGGENVSDIPGACANHNLLIWQETHSHAPPLRQIQKHWQCRATTLQTHCDMGLIKKKKVVALSLCLCKSGVTGVYLK